MNNTENLRKFSELMAKAEKNVKSRQIKRDRAKQKWRGKKRRHA